MDKRNNEDGKAIECLEGRRLNRCEGSAPAASVSSRHADSDVAGDSDVSPTTFALDSAARWRQALKILCSDA